MITRLVFLLLIFLASLTPLSCGSDKTPEQGLSCEPFDSKICTLPSGLKGLTTCTKDGTSWSTCDAAGCGTDNLEICVGRKIFASDSCGNIAQDTPKRLCPCDCTDRLDDCDRYDDPLSEGRSWAPGCQYVENALDVTWGCTELHMGDLTYHSLTITLTNVSSVNVTCQVVSYVFDLTTQWVTSSGISIGLWPGDSTVPTAYGGFDDAESCEASGIVPLKVSYRCIDQATTSMDCLPDVLVPDEEYTLTCLK